MAEKTETRGTTIRPLEKRDRIYWVGILLTPIIALTQLTANFSFARTACHAHTRSYLFAISATALLLDVIILFLVWRAGSGLARSPGHNEHDRPRFLAQISLAACFTFTLLMVALTIPHWLMNPCD